MARLTPYPFAGLVRRMFRELDTRQAIFDLPAQAFFLGDPRNDLSVEIHGRPASTPLGPAAGPHTQLAQNIVLAWLGGARVIELKTVQQNDRIEVPRPCIDVQTIGYNVEWSQELTLEESLEEYTKASMLIEILAASGALPIAFGAAQTVFDMSVGYDYAGITSERVQRFVRGMLDARPVVDRLRREIPDEFSRFRDLNFSTRLSDTLTLSTFHGCPPSEIQQIVEFLLQAHGVHVTVKLNPMLLGADETRRLLHDVLGYREIRLPDTAFAREATWDDAVHLVDRLGPIAAGIGLGFGIKLTNTLVVENHRSAFPAAQKEMYLSGPPLHVLAMQLVRRFRRQFGTRLPISFSGGIDRVNFPDAVALGLAPVTVCTDLLKPGGYARTHRYLEALTERMAACGAGSIDEFVTRAYGLGAAARPLAEARRLNTELYVQRATVDPRYGEAQNRRTPRKIGRSLALFDCLSCDKCVPVCPNGATFTFTVPPVTIAVERWWRENGAWRHARGGTLRIDAPHQLATFADFCNDCGNCDVFCPEDGGPQFAKPRLFGTREAWRDAAGLDGFAFERAEGREIMVGRFVGHEYEVAWTGGRIEYAGPDFSVTFDEADRQRTLAGEADAVVDLTYFEIMNLLRQGILGADAVNYVSARLGVRS